MGELRDHEFIDGTDDVELKKILIEAGAFRGDIYGYDYELLEAIKYGCSEFCIKNRFEMIEDINNEKKYVDNLFQIFELAISDNYGDKVIKYLLEKGISFIKANNGDNVIKYLLEKGISFIKGNGNCLGIDNDIISQFIAKFPEINKNDEFGWNLLNYIFWKKKHSKISYLKIFSK